MHPLIEELSKLKDSSKLAVADSNQVNNDELKRYLHIERQPEKEVKNIIRNAGQQQGPLLLLVCGNVGDGKSHLLASLREDEELAEVLSKFRIHNDATESFSPDEDCISTLGNILYPFCDDELGRNAEKWVLAINLGTLSNFLDEKKESFTQLKAYVEKSGLLEVDDTLVIGNYDDAIFHSVNLTDYHLYELTEAGPESNVISELLDRIVSERPDNPVYRAYLKVCQQSWAELCPIRLNFEFLKERNNREVIADLLIQVLVKEKHIISFRHLLNFFYDILVPYELAQSNLTEYEKKINSLDSAKRISYFIPYYIFEQRSISEIFGHLSNIDPCHLRGESLDELTITLHTSTSRAELLPPEIRIALALANGERDVKDHVLIKLFLRLYYFQNLKKRVYPDDNFLAFCKDLYGANTKSRDRLKAIFQLVKNAVLKWNGSNSESDKFILPIQSQDNLYRLFKQLDYKPNLPANTADRLYPKKLTHFNSQIVLYFKAEEEEISVHIDYYLYVLLKKINAGYRPNRIDRINNINFARFVSQLGLAETSKPDIFIDEINMGTSIDYFLGLDEFQDYKFERVRS